MVRECPQDLPLKIVLGSLAPSPKEQEAWTPPTTYILGTSYAYYSAPRNGKKYNKLNKDGRVAMEDRKGPFDHFRPKALALSVSLCAPDKSCITRTLFTSLFYF